MILILSQSIFETSTEQVQDWISCLGSESVRLNGEDLTSGDLFSFELTSEGERVTVSLEDRTLDASSVDVVWFRRWHTLESLAYLEEIDQHRFGREVRDHLAGELASVTGGLQVLLRRAAWLTRPRELRLNKLEALSVAARVGLTIPETIVTNNRSELEAFQLRHQGRVIVKPVGEATQFVYEGRVFSMYTSELGDSDLERIPSRFFPTLAQEAVPKAFEIRTFYLAGEHWSVAIFSQADDQTQIDFRRYNHERPNRTVPYALPQEVGEKVCRLMEELDLTTGSLDLVRTPDGQHVFLEVNPAGQFGMVGHPGNYRLEKRIAQHLIELERSHVG